MLTLYSTKSDFKKKLTVVVIWLVAIVLSLALMTFIESKQIPLSVKIAPVIVGLFMIAGILLRCKIARGLALITLYFLALYPLFANLLLDGSFILFSLDSANLFSPQEALLTNFIWALLFIVPIYFLSNNKSMDIFYIESNPKEHLFFIGGAIFLIFISLYSITLPMLGGVNG